MIVFLKGKKSYLEPLYPYFDASGDFVFAKLGEEHIPMGELWIDAYCDYFAPVDWGHQHRLFEEIHSVLEQWKSHRVRVLLSLPIESSQDSIRKQILLWESFSQFLQKAYGAHLLYLPPILESSSLHPALEIIHNVQKNIKTNLLWSAQSSVHVIKARFCAEALLQELALEDLMLTGRLCTLEDIKNTASMLWGKAPVSFEDAYSLSEKYLPIKSLCEEDEPLESLLFSLL